MLYFLGLLPLQDRHCVDQIMEHIQLGTARGAERAGTSSILDGLAAKSLWEGLIDVAEDLVFDSPLRPPLDILLELTPRLVRVRPVKPRQDPRAHLGEKARGRWVRSNHLIDGQGPLD